MDYSLFIKDKFLYQTVGNFSSGFEKADYMGFERIVAKNSIMGMAKIALLVCHKNVKSVFDKVDGIPIKQSGQNSIIRKDGFVDRDEMYQLIKESYNFVNGKEITEAEISKMTVKQAIDLVIDYWNKKK